MAKSKIIILDDEPMILSLVNDLLQEEPDIEISEMVTTKEEFLEKLRNRNFDLILMDLSFKKHNSGLEVLNILKAQGIDLPVIILSAHDEESYALKCLLSGAKGYVNKSYICSDLARGCREVLNGGMFISGSGKSILQEYHRLTP